MRITRACLTLMLGVLSLPAIPIYEPFDYDVSSNTNLIGRANVRDGLTWDQAGPDSGLTNQPGVISASLVYPGRPPAKGNMVRFGGNGTSARFSFRDSDIALTGTIYYSFLFKLTDSTTLNNSGVFWAGFNNTQGRQTGTPSVVAARLISKVDTNSTTGNFLVGLSKNSGTVSQFSFATNSLSTNDVILVVVSYTYLADSDNAGPTVDYCRLWLNPDPSTFGAGTPPEATLTNNAGGDLGNIRSLVLFNRNANEPGSVLVDELLIGNNWADVVPGTNDFLTVPPRKQTAVAGNDLFFDSRSQLADSLQWQLNGTAIPGATGRTLIISNVQPASAGTVSVTYSNAAGVATSNAAVSVQTNPMLGLAPLWILAPGDRPYLTIDSGLVRDQRSIAYYPPSNFVFIASMTNTVTGASTGQVYVLNGSTGGDLFQLNCDSSVITSDTTNSGNRALLSIEAGDDGALYGCDLTDNANSRVFRLYRWPGPDSSTPPELLYGLSGDPTGSSTQHRWGDTLAVRGIGNNSEILLDDDTGLYGLLFTNTGSAWSPAPFFLSKPRPSVSRSLQIGPTNSLWQKSLSVQYQGAGDLQKWTYTAALFSPLFPSSTEEVSANAFSTDVGPVALDTSRNLLVALSFTPISGDPDYVALYNISDLSNPVLLARYPFPITHQANGSFGKVILSGDRVYAINSNNGVLALSIVPVLQITRSGGNVILSWTSLLSGYTLQSTTALGTTWNPLGSGTLNGAVYTYTNPVSGGATFYRLSK